MRNRIEESEHGPEHESEERENLNLYDVMMYLMKKTRKMFYRSTFNAM